MRAAHDNAGTFTLQATEPASYSVSTHGQAAFRKPLLDFCHGGLPLGGVDEPGHAAVCNCSVPSELFDHVTGFRGQLGAVACSETTQYGRRGHQG